MATVEGRIQRLERQRQRLLREEEIRQLDNRSDEELLFFAQHGYFKTRNDSQRVVSAGEVRAYERELNEVSRGRTEAELLFFAINGDWPPNEEGESCRNR